MSRKFLRLFIRFMVITMALSFCYSTKYLRKDHQQNFSLLLDFTCATAKDELEKHPEMRTIAMVELENNFPSEFSREVLKCLPEDVAKIIINPHQQPHVLRSDALRLPKETLLLYIADKVDSEESFFKRQLLFTKYFPHVSHLSKHLIVSSDETKINRTKRIFEALLSVVQVYEKNLKVNARSFYRTKNLTTSVTFKSSQQENLSQILFPDKAKNLNGQELFAVWDEDNYAFPYKGSDRPNNKWTTYLDIIAEKLNATLKVTRIFPDKSSWKIYHRSKENLTMNLIEKGKLDFYLNYDARKHDLESYSNEDWCFLAPLPKPFSITELILFLPMDKSCWMWLGITIAVSTLIWRISEGHWNFAFGYFSYFMGQAQLIIRIRSNRLTMKILLQLLIFAIFIFSNGYQSLVTSFMLKPMKQKLLKSVDQILDSDLKIQKNRVFEELYDDDPKYQKAKQNGRIVEWNEIGGNWYAKMIDMKLARTQPCKMNKMRIEFQGDGKSLKGIYLINELAHTIPTELYTRPYHPYIENFQELMDRTFEAGLHQAWERFYWQNHRENFYKKTKFKKEKKILNFSSIAPFSLYILAFGLPASLLALFCEIFWKDFVMKLTKEYFERKWKEIFRREIKIEKKRPKVRRIQVKPAVRKNSLN